MERADAERLVIDTIVAHEHILASDFTLDSTAKDIGMDSLDVVEVILEIEDVIQDKTGKFFGFPDAEANKILEQSKVRELVDMVEKHGPTIGNRASTQEVQSDDRGGADSIKDSEKNSQGA